MLIGKVTSQGKLVVVCFNWTTLCLKPQAVVKLKCAQSKISLLISTQWVELLHHPPLWKALRKPLILYCLTECRYHSSSCKEQQVPPAWMHKPGDVCASTSLCTALAGVHKRIATILTHPEGLSALVACHLIPLNKCPGVRPIGVGEVPRRIIAKAILRIISKDVEAAAGPLQLCAGQDSGCKAAVHAMSSMILISKLLFYTHSTSQ